MAICPATYAGCIDDICYGSGCLKYPGEPMLMNCPGCQALIAVDGSDSEDCDCDPTDDEWEDDE